MVVTRHKNNYLHTQTRKDKVIKTDCEEISEDRTGDTFRLIKPGNLKYLPESRKNTQRNFKNRVNEIKGL